MVILYILTYQGTPRGSLPWLWMRTFTREPNPPDEAASLQLPRMNVSHPGSQLVVWFLCLFLFNVVL